MRNLLMTALAGSGLLLCSLTATAQDRDRDRDDYYNHQNGYYQQDGGEHVWLFNRLRSDLDRASTNEVPGSGDRMRIDRARHELNELQAKVSSGNYDRRDIQEAASAVDRVMDNNHMPDWARNRLSDDLGRLQNFR
jgi:hypothetical protein